MAKGVPISVDNLRRLRLVEYRKYEEIKELLRTYALVTSQVGDPNNALKFLKQYKDMILNEEKDMEKTIEENKEMLEAEVEKEYLVTPLNE